MPYLKNINIKILLTFTFSLCYAILRYNVFGNVPWAEIPLFVTNKAISLTSVFLLLFTLDIKNSKATRERLWKIIFVLTSIHVFISFRLLGPEYYSKFYTQNNLNIIGYATLFGGILAFTGILILNSDGKLPTENGKLTLSHSLKKWIRIAIPLLIALHVFSMGIKGWTTPYNWFGYMLPISLIGFVVITVFIVKTNRKK